MSDSRSDSERACLARLSEMDEALARMERELPQDMRPIGQRARTTVRLWLDRLAQGGADLRELSAAMREISGLMDALTERLLLLPLEREERGPPN
jgi:hypothetical protein